MNVMSTLPSCRLLTPLFVWGSILAAQAKEPTTHPATLPREPHVVYDTGFPFDRATHEQERLILDAGEKMKPTGQETWFIAIDYVSPFGVEARVFYTPEKATSRLRKGKSLYVRTTKITHDDVLNMPTAAEAARRKDVVEPAEGLADYVQVSRAGQSYAQKLDVPSRSELPFPPPDYPEELTGGGDVPKLDDDALVRLVDFARAQFKPGTWSDSICWVVGNGEDVFGVAQGVSDSGGIALHIRSEPGGFKIIGEVQWHDGDSVAWPPKCAKAASRVEQSTK
jgi:hypothetical protein